MYKLLECASIVYVWQIACFVILQFDWSNIFYNVNIHKLHVKGRLENHFTMFFSLRIA